jgi:hypothetical protein
MSLVQPTQPSTVLVAIDIAKLRHDVLIEAPGWKSRKRLILPNTAAEFRLLPCDLQNVSEALCHLPDYVDRTPLGRRKARGY